MTKNVFLLILIAFSSHVFGQDIKIPLNEYKLKVNINHNSKVSSLEKDLMSSFEKFKFVKLSQTDAQLQVIVHEEISAMDVISICRKHDVGAEIISSNTTSISEKKSIITDYGRKYHMNGNKPTKINKKDFQSYPVQRKKYILNNPHLFDLI